MSVHVILKATPGKTPPPPVHHQDAGDDTYSYRTSRSGTLYISRTRRGRRHHVQLHLSGDWQHVSGKQDEPTRQKQPTS